MSLLDDLLAELAGTQPDLKDKIENDLRQKARVMTAPWMPNPGPQTEAFFHPADVLLYGGSGGGGKTDLAVGLAYTKHRRSLLLRRKYSDLGGLIDRTREIHGVNNPGFNGKPPPRLSFMRDGLPCLIDFVGNQLLGDEQSQQGRPYDFKAFDEATQFLELQLRFHLGWIRTTEPDQRTRALLMSNPPIDSNGDWIIGFFRPWLDLTHPKPAAPGELRWFVRSPKDETDIEVDGPAPVELPGAEKPLIPMSRSFMPARLSDNPYLVNTGYGAALDALPEPIRSAVRDGNFMAHRPDTPNQMIPTAWILEAQARWRPEIPEGYAMTALAADIAQGGKDTTTLAARYGGYYPKLISKPGVETPDGASVVAMIAQARRDACPIILDGGGGFAGATAEKLRDNGIDPVIYKGAEGAPGKREKSGIMGFYNKRAWAYWRFREELDPEQEGGSAIALPPDPELVSQLSAVTFETVTRMGLLCIKAETKEDVRAKLGISPDKSDAVVMAFCEGERVAVRNKRRGRGDLPTKSNRGYRDLKGD